MTTYSAQVDQLQGENEAAWRLAKLASFAVRVEPALIRRLRRRFLPDQDAGVEGDVWFSSIVQHQNSDGIVFHPAAALRLRERLFKDAAAAGNDEFQQAWQETQASHADLPPPILLEEEIAYTWTKYVYGNPAEQQGLLAEMGRLLQSAVTSLVDGDHRGLANWAARALANLPADLLRLEAAQMLATAASLRLDEPIPDELVDSEKPLPAWLHWVAPSDWRESQGKQTLALRLFDGVLEVSAAPLDRVQDQSAHHQLIEVPDSDPIILEIASGQEISDRPDPWRQSKTIRVDTEEARRTRVEPGRVQIRTLSGEIYELQEQGEAAVERSAEIIDFANLLSLHRPFYGRAELLGEIEAIVNDAWDDPALVMITGIRGRGKTAVIAHLVDRFAERQELVTVKHFFSRDIAEWADPQDAVRSICTQIEAHAPGLRGAERWPRHRLNGLFRRFAATESSHQSKKTLVVLLDGLDEADFENGLRYADCFPAALPTGVVVIATSEDPQAMLNRRLLSLDLDNPRLLDARENGILPFFQSQSGDYTERAAEVTDNNWLYARMLSDWARQRFRDESSQDYIWDVLLSEFGTSITPGDIENLTEVIAKDLSQRSDDSLIRDVTTLLAVARQAVPQRVIERALAASQQVTDRVVDVKIDFELLQSMSPLIDVYGDPRGDSALIRLRVRLDQEMLFQGGAHNAMAEALAHWPPPEDWKQPTETFALRQALYHAVQGGDDQLAAALYRNVDYLQARCQLEGVTRLLEDLEEIAPAPGAAEAPIVYLSFSFEDDEARLWNDRLGKLLQKQGFSWTTNQGALERSDDWKTEINRTLSHCNAAILLVSPASLKSDFARYEAMALMQRKNTEKHFEVMPILVGGVSYKRLLGSKLGQIGLDRLQHLRADDAAIESQIVARLEVWKQPKQPSPRQQDDTPEVRHLASVLRDQREWIEQDPAALPSLLFDRLRRADWSAAKIQTTFRFSDQSTPRLRLRHQVGESNEPQAPPRHGGTVLGARFSPAGGYVVSYAEDGTIIRWDGNAGTRVWAHDAAVTDCAIHSGGDRLITTSRDFSVKVWDTQNLELQHDLGGHAGEVLRVKLIDNERVVTCSADHTLRIWDALQGEHLHTLVGHQDVVMDCVVNADGTRAVSCSRDRTVRAWDLESGQQVGTPVAGHTAPVTALALSPDGQLVASCSQDSTLRVWELGKELTWRLTLAEHSLAVTGCQFTGDGRQLVSWSQDHTLRVWDLASGKLQHVLRGHTSAVTSCALWKRNAWAISCSADNRLLAWNYENGEFVDDLTESVGVIRKVEAALQESFALLVVGSADLLLLIGEDRTVRVWELPQNSSKEILGKRPPAGLLLAGPDREQVFQARGDGIDQVDPATGNSARILNMAAEEDLLAGAVASGSEWLMRTADGFIISHATVVGEGTVRQESHGRMLTLTRQRGAAISSDLQQKLTWTGETVSFWGQQPFFVELAHQAIVKCELDPHGRFCAVLTQRGLVELLDLQSGEKHATLEAHRGRVLGCVFLGADRLATWGADQTVAVWSLTPPYLLQQTYDVGGLPTCCGASEDGRWLVVGTDAGSLFAVSDYSLTILGHTDRVNDVKFSGQRGPVVTCSDDRTVRLWEIESSACLATTYGPRPFLRLLASDAWICATDEAEHLWVLEYGELKRPSTGRALLLTGLQNDFLPGGALAVPDGDEVVPIANQLLEQFGTVVATQDWHPIDHSSFAEHGGLWPRHCVQNTIGANFAEGLRVERITRVFRTGTDHGSDSQTSAFAIDDNVAGSLQAYLQEHGVKELYVMGLATEYGVKATVLDAVRRGFDTYVIMDGCRGVDGNTGDSERAIDLMQAEAKMVESTVLIHAG